MESESEANDSSDVFPTQSLLIFSGILCASGKIEVALSSFVSFYILIDYVSPHLSFGFGITTRVPVTFLKKSINANIKTVFQIEWAIK